MGIFNVILKKKLHRAFAGRSLIGVTVPHQAYGKIQYVSDHVSNLDDAVNLGFYASKPLNTERVGDGSR